MSYASLFVPRGTCCNSKPKNHFLVLCTSSRYASMCSSFGSYTLLEKVTRSWGSPLMVLALHSQGCRSLEAGDQAFVLRDVVGDLLALLETELHGVVELVLGGRDEHCSSSRALVRKSAIEIHDPAIWCFTSWRGIGPRLLQARGCRSILPRGRRGRLP